MIEVGIRELKSRLSYYVQLAQAGETVAIKVRHRVVGFLSKFLPSQVEEGEKRRRSRRQVEALIKKWKREGFLISGGLYHHRPFKPVKLKGDKSLSDIVKEIREEDL